MRLVFNVYTISIAAFLFLGVFLTATYFWFEFSDRIDQKLLSGEVFTASAGIYSAPKTLKVGEAITPADLVEYLKSAGYIEKNNQADATRSRYSVEGDLVAIEPGITGVIDGRKILRIADGKIFKRRENGRGHRRPRYFGTNTGDKT